MSTSSGLRFTFVALVFGACATSERGASPERTQPAAAAVPATRAPGAASPGPAEQPAVAPPSSVAPGLVPPDPVTGTAAARVAELSAKAQALVDAFLNSEALLTRDGKQVVFVSNRDGLPQLYVGDAARPSSPARRLLETNERMTLDATTPDGKAVLFRTDHGADEKWSIWRVNLDGSGAVDLTPGEPLEREHAQVADLAPDTVYFSGRRISEASSAVYAAPLAAPGPAREVYRDAKPGSLVDVSRDGKRALFVKFPTNSENYLATIDLASGAARTLYPESGKVTISDARFSPDGRTAYVATDGGGEQAWLLALDAESGKEIARYVEKNPPIATIDTIAAAKTGDALALLIDAGNRTELRLLDARTLRPRSKVAMPLGQGFLSDFSEDGKSFVARWSTPSSPYDPWAIDAKTGKATLLRREPRASLKELPEIEVSVAETKAHDGLGLPMNVLLPKNRSGKLPVIVSYHGGPAYSSRIRWSATTAFFLSQGYAWVEPNVRGSTGFGRAFEEADNGPQRLEAFKDIETTGRWVASQPWADPKRLIIFGGSYGGYTVLIGLTRMPDLWRAGINLFGVANVRTTLATTTGLIREVFLLEFGDVDKDAAFLESISPVKDADKIVAPLFVYAGANDPRVPRSESDMIVRALRVRSVPVEYMVADNEGHSLARKENLVHFLARSARFLEHHLGPPTAPRTASAR
jgi:dipeptidyl aminopeptidase/acylaminoacyl peptidase